MECVSGSSLLQVLLCWQGGWQRRQLAAAFCRLALTTLLCQTFLGLAGASAEDEGKLCV